MEEPDSLSAHHINYQRNQLLSAMHLEGTGLYGQYQGYIEDAGIPTITSHTETAAALKFGIDLPRWQGVPIYVRAGKRLQQAVTEVSIQFKEPANRMFKHQHHQQPNVLTLRIQPNEGVVLRLSAKRPGLSLSLEDVPMQFCYHNTFQMDLVEAYVKLIYDAINGDASLFPDVTGIERAWEIVDPILVKKRQPEFLVEPYQPGSWGPKSFDSFIRRDGREWLEPSELFCAIR